MSTDPKTQKIPSAEDFSHSSIQKAVLKETIQHPLTIFPFVVSLVSMFYMGIIEPDPRVFAVSLAGGALSVGVWIVNYFFRGEKYAETHVQKLKAKREASKREEISALLLRFQEKQFAEGVQAARELHQAYEKLRQFLADRISAGDANAQRFMILAEDVFQKGRALLQEALDTYTALKLIDRDKLQRELKEWNQQAELHRKKMSLNEFEQSQLTSYETKIASNEKRITLYNQHITKIQELLAECERLEASLETAYLQVIELIERDPDTIFKGNVSTELERAVLAAKRVEDRLRAGSMLTQVEENEYLEAGRNSHKENL